MHLSKSIPACFALVLALAAGCEKTIYETDPRLLNDALHGAITGTVVQKESQARVIVNQETVIDSVQIDPASGIFRLEDLPLGNYDLNIRADNFRIYSRSNVLVTGAGTTYIGRIDLSSVPDLVAEHYPEDQAEIVYNNRFAQLAVSVIFTRPMDRASVEQAFTTDPPSDGIFYWGTYTQAPTRTYFEDANRAGGFEPGATITTFSKITSFSYRLAQKDSYTDTTYRVTLATTARDTAGNPLRFPMTFSFRTVQSSSTINGILTVPSHGDVEVDLRSNGIEVTFPRNMKPAETEAAISMTPSVERVYLWPEYNRLTIYTGGPLMAETEYTIAIDSTALDRDGIPLGKPFSFSFFTAPVQVRSTSPRNAELFVPQTTNIVMWFNTYMIKSTVESAFSITPAVRGTFTWGTGSSTNDRSAITFRPGTPLTANTKYTVSLDTRAADLYGTALHAPYSFAFVTRPE